MNFRQIHLDFHTSGIIPEIGADFSRKQFADALKAGHVNSITLFSKCHHGYAYHPSEANEIHPGLNFDLLGEQLAVCRELGINAPVYISAGFDEKEALRHPEWLVVGSPGAGHDFITHAGYHLFCYNSPYLDKLLAQVEEVMKRYNPSGIFLDISNIRTCYCHNCIQSMLDAGRNPNNPDDVHAHAEEVYANYCKKVEEVIRKYNPNTTIFHNAGHIAKGRRDIAGYDTHLELESLPTGGWGYDHFPMSAAYVRNLGMNYLGMTGKFHTTWGEFGGFKHPNALRYETALSIAFGAKCSIGDQLHPRGKMNMSTYKLIGQAYAEVEQKEAWCDNVSAVSDIAVLSCEACGISDSRGNKSDVGCCRILLEGKYLFDVIDLQCNFDKYKLIILPDYITLNDELAQRIRTYIKNGGKILATGESGLNKNKSEFMLDFGAEFTGESEYQPTYMVPSDELHMVNGVTEYVMYTKAYEIKPNEDAQCIAQIAYPYFNRGAFHFSSHQHTPNMPGSKPNAVFNGNTAYIGWSIFEDYATKGSLHLKELAINAIEMLIGNEKTIAVSNLPDRGIVTLMKQGDRLVNHVLFAHTCVRGNGIEVIEDTVPLCDIDIAVKLDKKPNRVYLAPQNQNLRYNYTDGVLFYRLPKLDIHQMIVIE